MRSKALRKRGDSFIKTPEPTPKKPKVWGKYLYVTLLVVLGGSAIRWAYEEALYFDGIGYLEAESKLLEAPETGRIVNMRCNINDQVFDGEALVFLSNPRTTYSMNRRVAGGWPLSDEAKIIDIESNINLLQQEIRQTSEDVSSFRDEHQRARELLTVQAITRSQLSVVEKRLRQSENDLKLLKIKYEAALKILKLYQDSPLQEDGDVLGNSNNREGILTAPATGVVSEIYKQRGEVAKIGEPILKISETDRTFIKTYFTGEHEAALKVGNEAKLVFENGEKSVGVVRKIYPTAFDQPKQMKNRFGSTQRYIIAEIVPTAGQSWERILETEVSVSIKRKWF